MRNEAGRSWWKENNKRGYKHKEKGVNSILISMGSLGAVYVTDNGIYTSKALKVPVKNTVGAGDSMVAALVYSLINNLDDMDTLSFA